MTMEHEHDLHRMDDDGYTNHAQLHHHAKKRFFKAARAYCAHMEGHVTLDGDPYAAMLLAYKRYRDTA